MKQNKTGNQYLNERPGPTTRIRDKYDKGESKESEISKSFPNFMALTEKEKLAFFEALSAARRNVEKSGNPSRKRFGTVHDEYLLYFDKKEKENNLTEDADEIGNGEYDATVIDCQRNLHQNYNEKNSESEVEDISKEVSDRSLDKSGSSDFSEKRNTEDRMNDSELRKAKMATRSSKSKESEKEDKSTKTVNLQREETTKFSNAVRAADNALHKESSDCVTLDLAMTSSASGSVVTIHRNTDSDELTPLNGSFNSDRTGNSTSTDQTNTLKLVSTESELDKEAQSKLTLLDEYESILKKDTDTIINKYLKKKKKREKELHVKIEDPLSPNDSSTQILSRNKSKCVMMVNQNGAPAPLKENIQPCGNEKEKTQKNNMETFVPPILGSTPRFDALNEKEKEIFFNTLKEAHQKILEKSPEKKDEIIPIEAIFKGYNNPAKSTTVFTSITKEILLEDNKKKLKENDRNLMVKVTVTSADNERLKRMEQGDDYVEKPLDCTRPPAVEEPIKVETVKPKKVEIVGIKKKTGEFCIEDEESKRKLKEKEHILREKEAKLKKMEMELLEKENELKMKESRFDGQISAWKKPPIDSRERLLAKPEEPDSSFDIHRETSLMDVKKTEASGGATIVFRKCPKEVNGELKLSKKNRAKLLKKKKEEEKIRRRMEEEELLKDRLRKRKEEEEAEEHRRKTEEEEKKREEAKEKKMRRKQAEEERGKYRKDEDFKRPSRKDSRKDGDEDEKRYSKSLENRRSATRGFLELLEVISIDLTPKEVDKVEMVNVPFERIKVISPSLQKEEITLGFHTESGEKMSEESDYSDEATFDKETNVELEKENDDDDDDYEDVKKLVDVRSAITITKERQDVSNVTIGNLEKEDEKKASIDFVTDRPMEVEGDTEVQSVSIEEKPGKIVLVNDDIIFKIKRLIEDLERKAKAEEDYTRNEYAQLLQDYMNYLNRVLQSLVEQKNQKKQIHVQTSFTAAEVHLKFKEHKSKKDPATTGSKEEVNKTPKEKEENTKEEEDQSDIHLSRKSSLLIHESDSGSSLDSEIWAQLGGPLYTKKQTLPNTKIRLLQDLLKDRAEFVEGSINQFKIVHKSAESFVPTKTEKIEVELNNEEYEVLEKSKKFIRFFTAIGRFCHCVKTETVVEDEVLENLKGEAVPVVVSSGKKNPASATLNNSTMEVLEAAKRKKIIQKYWQHQKV